MLTTSGIFNVFYALGFNVHHYFNLVFDCVDKTASARVINAGGSICVCLHFAFLMLLVGKFSSS